MEMRRTGVQPGGRDNVAGASLRELFHEVAGMPAEERSRIFAERRVPPDLRVEVESLLRYDSSGGPFLTRRVHQVAEQALLWDGGSVPRCCGPYRLLGPLGAGGMGAVYLAERCDGEIEQRVAVKFLRADADCPEWRAHFLRERQLLAYLNHSSIARLLDAGHTVDGRPYLVMEYVDGTPIDEYAAPLDLRARLRLFLQVCEGVSHAHRHLVVHRDLKPSNVFLVPQPGRGPLAKLLDLGIAKVASAPSDGAPLTRTGLIVGTPGYMAPEQCSSEAPDARTDIYALGIVLYEMAVGSGPFAAESVESMLYAQIATEPRPPRLAAPERQLPEELDRIVLRCLRKERRDRYQDAAELEADLLALHRQIAPADVTPGFVALADTGAHLRPVVPLGGGKARGPARSHVVSEVAPGVHRLGERAEGLLESNTYLLTLAGAGRTFRALVDPGAPEDFEALAEDTRALVGPDEGPDVVFVNHQDMDVALNVPAFLAAFPEAAVVCSEDAWRFLRLTGADARRLRTVESFWNRRMRLPTGHTLHFEPTPHCHVRGATMLYEPEGRVLFSGDLLGGFSMGGALGGSEAETPEAAWEGIRLFHRLYMPSQEALRFAAARIRALDPPPRLIAPQHGSLIPEEWIPTFLRRLERLPVGLEAYFTEASSENYLRLVNEFLAAARRLLGVAPVDDVLRRFESDRVFPRSLEFADGVVVGFRVEPRSTTSALLQRLLRASAEALRPDVLRAARAAFERRDIPPPDWLVRDASGEGSATADTAAGEAPLLVEV